MDDELFDGTLLFVDEPWERWEDADSVELDESGYFRELGRRLALERA